MSLRVWALVGLVGCGAPSSGVIHAPVVRVSAPAEPRLIADLSEGVEHVVVTDDGSLAATITPGRRSWSGRPAAIIWDTRRGRDLYRLPHVTALAFGAGGTMLTGDADGHVTLREAATGREVRRVGELEHPAVWVGFTTGGGEIATDYATFHEWDAGGHELRTWASANGGFSAAALVSWFAQSSAHKIVDLMFTNGTSDMYAVWSLDDAAPKKITTALKGWRPVTGGLALTMDDRAAFGVSSYPKKQAVVIVDLASQQIVNELPGAEGHVLAFRGDGRLIAAGKALEQWSVADARRISSSPLPAGAEVEQGAFVADASRIVAATTTGVEVIDVASGRVSAHFGHADTVAAIAWSPDGKRLVSAGGSHRVTVWDAGGGGAPLSLDAGEPVSAVAVTDDGRVAAGLAGYESQLLVWTGGAKQAMRLKWHALETLVFDGTHVLGAEGSNTFAWDAAGAELDAPAGRIATRLSVPSPDASLHADADGARVIVRHGANDGVVAILRAPSAIRALDWRGNVLAAAREDGLIQLWDPVASMSLGTLDVAHDEGPVSQIAFRPDGRVLAVARLDGLVDLWDVPSRTRVARLFAAADGHWMVIGRDGRVDGDPGPDAPLTWERGGETLPASALWANQATPRLLVAALDGAPPALAVTPVPDPSRVPAACLPAGDYQTELGLATVTGSKLSACLLHEPDDAWCFDVELATGVATFVVPSLDMQSATSTGARPPLPAPPSGFTATYDEDTSKYKICAPGGSPCHDLADAATVTDDGALIAVRTSDSHVDVLDGKTMKRLRRVPVAQEGQGGSGVGFWGHTLLFSSTPCAGPCSTSVMYDATSGRRLGHVGSDDYPANTDEFHPLLLHDDVWAFPEDFDGGAIVLQESKTGHHVARVTPAQLGLGDAASLSYSLVRSPDGGLVIAGTHAFAGKVWVVDPRGKVVHAWQAPACP